MSGCGVGSNTGAVGEPSRRFLRPKKKKIKAVTEIITTPPTTPPAMAATLEEEPLELDEEDEVGVGGDEEDGMAEEPGVLITAPGPASGESEKVGQ
jgi:hypothetical protein